MNEKLKNNYFLLIIVAITLIIDAALLASLTIQSNTTKELKQKEQELLALKHQISTYNKLIQKNELINEEGKKYQSKKAELQEQKDKLNQEKENLKN